MKKIDTRGKLCPMPLIIFKSEIKNIKQGETIEILTDNDMACQNLTDYIAELGITPNKIVDNGYTKLVFDYITCELPQKKNNNDNDYIIILNTDVLGKGNNDLGRILMKAFVNTIENLDSIPKKIICYNAGVKLLIKGTDTASSLDKLRKNNNIEILACGTCIEFYELQDKIIDHKVANMFNILDIQSKARKIIYP